MPLLKPGAIESSQTGIYRSKNATLKQTVASKWLLEKVSLIGQLQIIAAED